MLRARAGVLNMAEQQKLAVIIPAYNASSTLDDCLSGLAGSKRRPDEIILYNDGSTDDTVEIANRFGVNVITNDGAPKGPAAGRNICAQNTDADLLVFIDADVKVHENSIGDLEAAILSAPDIAAAFGSYDDAPRSKRLAALYANLRHHFYHQHSNREASTFWSGFGAIKRDIFLTKKGYDTRFSQPSIEDVEFGVRLRNAGYRILLTPEAQAKHCKDWGLIQLWRTDIFQRALPWSKLIVSGKTAGADLNTSVRERLIVIFAHLLLFLAFGSIFAPVLLWGLAAVAVIYAGLNFQFYDLLARCGGVGLLFGGAILHWLYHMYACSVFVFVLLTHRGPRNGRSGEGAGRKTERHAG